MQDILSQDEIDALFGGVESGEVETSADGGDQQVKLCDLTSKDKIIRARLPSLDIINKKYTRLLRMTMFNLLQRNAEVSQGPVEVLKFSEYLQTMFVPTSVNIVRFNPLRGVGMVILDAKLVFGLVDLFFGGGGRYTKIEGREFTVIENRIIDKVLTRTFGDLSEAWQNVTTLECERIGSEMNPMMATVYGSDEMMVISPFNIELDGVKGQIDIAMPYSMLEPVLDAIDAGVKSDEEHEEQWGDMLLEHISDVDVGLSCSVAETMLTFRDVNTLKVGDVIPIQMNDAATLSANDVPIYKTRFGSSNGKVALRILESMGQDH